MELQNEPNVKQEQKLLKIVIVASIITVIAGAVFFLAGNLLPSTKSLAKDKQAKNGISGSIGSDENLEIFKNMANGDTLVVEKKLGIDETLKLLQDKDVVIVLEDYEMRWEGEYQLYLGKGSKIIMLGKGDLNCINKYVGGESAIFFGETKLVSADGTDAKYSFEDVNSSSGVYGDGLITKSLSVSGGVKSKVNQAIFEKAMNGDTIRVDKILEIDGTLESLKEKDVVILLDKAELKWKGKYKLYLGKGGKIVLMNEGNLTASEKNYGVDASIFFDDYKLVSYTGGTAKYSFEEVNKSGGVSYDGLTPLPVKLVRFETTIENNKVLIKWATASEINNSHFDIQRSTDTKTWKVIGTVKGHGNSTNLINYSFIDNSGMASGTLYYRLHQVDFNGEDDYGPISVVNGEKPKVAKVYPNPASDVLRISFDAGQYQLTITDLTGSVVLSKEVNTDFESVDISAITNGAYMVKLQNETISESHKIVIRH